METIKTFVVKLKNKYGTYYFNGVFELGKEMLVNNKKNAFIYTDKKEAKQIADKLNISTFTTPTYKWSVETIEKFAFSGQKARQIIYDYLLNQQDNKKWLGMKKNLKRGQYDVYLQIYLTESKDINNIRLDGVGGNADYGPIGEFHIPCSDDDCILIAEYLKLIN